MDKMAPVLSVRSACRDNMFQARVEYRQVHPWGEANESSDENDSGVRNFTAFVRSKGTQRGRGARRCECRGDDGCADSQGNPRAQRVDGQPGIFVGSHRAAPDWFSAAEAGE